MMLPSELTTIISLTSNGKIWIYLVLFIVFSYLLISLLTWSFIKPLKYLGIPTIIVGMIFLIIRFASPLLLNTITTSSELNLIRVLLPSMLQSVLINALVCLGAGILMLILYNLLNKKMTKN